jgi:hypothetical protein
VLRAAQEGKEDEGEASEGDINIPHDSATRHARMLEYTGQNGKARSRRRASSPM